MSDGIFKQLNKADPPPQTYHNGNNWYRKYSDGWVEQGGKCGVGQSVSVTFQIPFKAVDYFIAFIHGTPGSDINWNGGITNRTTTSASYNTNIPGSQYVLWEACGYAAE